jgi:hypothetical protein
MKTKPSTSRFFTVTLATIGLSLPLYAAIISNPTWYGDPNTTYQSYTFSTNSTTPAPETVNNPYGAPDMLITVVPFIGVGTGYQDPNEFSVTRVDGAWDLGPDGSIAVDVPIGPAVGIGPGYILDYFISVVYEGGLYSVPDTFFTPVSIANTTVNPTFEQDGIYRWHLLTAEGTISEVPTNLLQVLFDATGSNGSIVDTVEIHTRYTIIPEAGFYSLGLGLGTLGLILFRRFRSRV